MGSWILVKGKIVNTYKKIILSTLLLACVQTFNAAVPCGSSAPGVLNVGILPANLPYSEIVDGVAVGFDPLLAQAVAKLLGYDTVNFIGFGNSTAAEAALLAGTIDIYANSATSLSVPPAVELIGVVTDISALYAVNEINGWLLNSTCCQFAQQLQAAINQVVASGSYAQILQQLRFNGLTAGRLLGQPFAFGPSTALLEPFPFASDEIGTIPPVCALNGPASLPQRNCVSTYLQSVCSPSTSFTGATGRIDR